ncbi:aminodeoxychorismate lyase [Aliidiomarina sedimenti]|uniref:Aminodeoxychorismate lyase n=1 Tax=Aliidiomarina sedimenti TaxID=1933879 RepID=A0ABY0C245_9GAMM|nr:aminodeoxychorismate lyase [Aliidiomarina sedimenti]
MLKEPVLTQILLNGKPAESIALQDRGLLYGDGFFTTIRLLDGEPQLWQRHQQRLLLTAQRLRFELADSSLLMQQCLQECRQLGADSAECAVRITLTRGSGGRGYQAPATSQTQRILSRTAVPAHYAEWRRQGIALQLSQQTLAIQPMLAGLKTLNRLEQVLLKQELAETDNADELIVCDSNGFVCESTASNLFWRRHNTWYTSKLDKSGIKGVVRAELLAHNSVAQGDYPLHHLQQAEQAFICNSLMGLVPVHTIMGRRLAQTADYPDQLTTRLNEGR